MEASFPLSQNGVWHTGSPRAWLPKAWVSPELGYEVGSYSMSLGTLGTRPQQYWSHAGDMSPVNRCNLFLNRCLAKCTASLVLFGRETEAGPIGHSTELRSGVGSTFSRGSESVWFYWVNVKGCHVWGPPAGSVWVAYVDWCRKHMCCVYQVFPYRVYIDSNRCDSRIVNQWNHVY
jgi:hypothetical protein